jgi:hypothetical protein
LVSRWSTKTSQHLFINTSKLVMTKDMHAISSLSFPPPSPPSSLSSMAFGPPPRVVMFGATSTSVLSQTDFRNN